MCTLLMRREGGKYTKTKLRCTCEFLRVVGEGESWLTSASSWGGMRMWWWACGCQDDHLCNTLSFQEPWLLSSLNLKADSVAEAGLADARGCAAGADRTCADRSSIVRSTLQLTSACQPFSAVAREGAAVTLAFDGLVTFWGYCVASGRWSVVKLLRQVMKAQWRPFDATESAKSLPSLAEESVSKAGFSAVSVMRSLSEAGRQGPDVPSQPARGPLGSLHKGHCGRSSISAVVSSFSFSHFWQQQMIHHCEFPGLTVLSSIHLTAGPQLEPNEVD